MITMENVCKSYRIAKRNAGFKEACKSFFRREYEVIHALQDVSFTIEDGEMVGYIGPNGAGKSSTIKILSGILTPDSGRCLVDGRVPWKNRIEHVTTHDMQDIEALTRRIILIGKGRILMDGTLEDIKKGGSSIDETVAELYRSYDI